MVAAWHASRARAAGVIRTGRAAALRIDRGVTHSRDMQCVHSMSPSLGGERESLHRAARHPQKAGRESLLMKCFQRATSTRNCVAGRVLRLGALAQRSTLLAMTRQRRSTRLMTCTAQSSYVSRASASECDQAWKTTCTKRRHLAESFSTARSCRLATGDADETYRSSANVMRPLTAHVADNGCRLTARCTTRRVRRTHARMHTSTSCALRVHVAPAALPVT